MAVMATALLVFGVVQMVRAGEFSWFLLLWVLAGLIVVSVFLTSWLGKGPRMFTAQSEAQDSNRRVTLSKPVAVLGTVVALAILTVGTVGLVRAERFGFLMLWLGFGAAIIGLNLSSAFRKKGSAHRRDREE
ncbi:hypothetical protein Afe04nite_03650 [Asanoa ferruginea]|nr:hypothetical protein Afe04nite_03650 [Asanoa ferruginea]